MVSRSRLPQHDFAGRRKLIGISFDDFLSQLDDNEDLVFETYREGSVHSRVLKTIYEFETFVVDTEGIEIRGFWAIPGRQTRVFSRQVPPVETYEIFEDPSWKIISRPTEALAFACILRNIPLSLLYGSN